ncbi:MAG: hypothetical protein PHR35_21390, partial [Kiritimatiellae bacterium]|nr:hypothetical protein [Kiritimatiellia bacterium]
EPTSGLDPIACREVKDWLRLLAAGGMTVLLTSHLLADVEDVCHRVAILRDGTVRAGGSVAELLQRRDAVRLSIEGIEAAQAEALRRELESRLARPVGCDHPRIGLEDFFLRAVSETGDTGQEQRRPPAEFLRRPPAPPAAREAAT